jgi:hypothetical protein
MVGRVATFLAAIFCLAMFIASVSVHVLSLIPGTVLPFDGCALLHLGAMAAVFAVIIHTRSVRRRANAAGMQGKRITDLLMRSTPRLFTRIEAFLFFYVIFNFVYFVITHEGTPRIRDNKYVLMHKSTHLRDLTEEEYHEYTRRELRGMSGHWLLFSGLALGYFVLVVPRVRERLESWPAS